MIKITKTDVYGFEAAIRGMRNPMASWDKSDSFYCDGEYCSYFYNLERKDCTKYISGECADIEDGFFVLGKNDLELASKLSKAGTDHAKFMRYINVTCDITAPLYWWKEFDTYKVGTVANSTSTMHKIHAKEFTLDDFSHEYLEKTESLEPLKEIVNLLNDAREIYNNYEIYQEEIEEHGDTKKDVWYVMIQLLPSSYNQTRTVQFNYAVLKNMYHARKNHKLDEWREFCNWIENELPYAKELIL